MELVSVSPKKIVTISFTRKRDVSVSKELTFSGHTMQLITEARYLGLILNQGLTRKAQLKNMMNKAYRSL
jgi:hypothetical protein